MEVSTPATTTEELVGLRGDGLTLAYRAVLSRVLAHWEVWPIVGLALLSAVAYLQSAPVFALPFDDSYISLHFARNLAEHGFLTFDGESASAGATSLLHVVLLAVPIKLGMNPERASVGLGVLLHLGLVVALYWLAWTLFRDRLAGGLAAASGAVMGYLTLDALNGMETTLFMLVTALAAGSLFGANSDRRYLAAGLFGALAVLTRPEGVLLVAAMTLYHLVDPMRGHPAMSAPTLRRLVLLAGPGAVALAGLSLFYLATTGAFTPGTGTAKLLFFREFEWPLQEKANAFQGGVANFGAGVLPWLALAPFAIRRREALLFAFFWVAFMTIYLVLFPGGVTHYWYRYQHVFLPAIAAFGAGGLAFLVRRHTPRGWDLATAAVIGAALVAGLVFQYNNLRNGYADDVRATSAQQVAIALFLRDETPPDATVAAHDIGALAYFSEREVIDLVGLANPDVVEQHDGRRLRQFVDEARPDYIVTFPSWERHFLQLGLLTDQDLFEEVKRFGAGREPLIVYRTNY